MISGEIASCGASAVAALPHCLQNFAVDVSSAEQSPQKFVAGIGLNAD
jgi:hypothetical protein